MSFKLDFFPICNRFLRKSKFQFYFLLRNQIFGFQEPRPLLGKLQESLVSDGLYAPFYMEVSF